MTSVNNESGGSFTYKGRNVPLIPWSEIMNQGANPPTPPAVSPQCRQKLKLLGVMEERISVMPLKDKAKGEQALAIMKNTLGGSCTP